MCFTGQFEFSVLCRHRVNTPNCSSLLFFFWFSAPSSQFIYITCLYFSRSPNPIVVEKSTLYMNSSDARAASETFADELRSAEEVIQLVAGKYPPQRIGISFNGGKDSVLMVELLLRTLGAAFVGQCRTFVLDEPDEFPEMIAFRDNYIQERLPQATVLHASAATGLRDGLWEVKRATDIEAVFLGTRRADPSGKYQSGPLAPTTTGWPPMLRACPLFDWSFESVWEYTLQHNIPRCPLYEKGYASLGGRNVTHRNPNLCQADGSFLPAWSLSSGDYERCGRSTDTMGTNHSPVLANTSGISVADDRRNNMNDSPEGDLLRCTFHCFSRHYLVFYLYLSISIYLVISGILVELSSRLYFFL
eukprot:gene8641-6070_t